MEAVFKGTETVLTIIEQKIKELGTAPECGTFSRDYIQGQAAGMVTALHITKLITDDEYQELSKRIYEY